MERKGKGRFWRRKQAGPALGHILGAIPVPQQPRELGHIPCEGGPSRLLLNQRVSTKCGALHELEFCIEAAEEANS